MADAIVKVVLFLCSIDLFSHLAEAIESAIKDVEFSLFFLMVFSCFPCILRFGSCVLRVLRIVKLNDDSRDLSVSNSPYVFSIENANSEGRLLVAHAREAGSIISPFPVSPRFLEEKCEF